MQKPYQAIVAGLLCVDIVPKFNPEFRRDLSEIFTPGQLTYVERLEWNTGGPVSNTGIALQLMGCETRLIAKVGDDLLGNIAKQLVGQYAPSDSIVTQKGDTSYSIVLAPPDIDRIFLHSATMSRTFHSSDVQLQKGSERLFHFGYPPLMPPMFRNDGSESVDLFKRARACGMVTSLDMSVPDPLAEDGKQDWIAYFKNVLPYVDIFLPSVDELAFMLRKTQEDITDVRVLGEMAEQCIDMGAKVVLIKCGARGLYLRTAPQSRMQELVDAWQPDLKAWSGRELFAGSFTPRKVVSALGAGDNCIAGFLMAVLGGEAPEQALRYGALAGALNVEVIDTLSGVVPFETMREMLKSDPPYQALSLPDSFKTLFENVSCGPGDATRE